MNLSNVSLEGLNFPLSDSGVNLDLHSCAVIYTFFWRVREKQRWAKFLGEEIRQRRQDRQSREMRRVFATVSSSSGNSNETREKETLTRSCFFLCPFLSGARPKLKRNGCWSSSSRPRRRAFAKYMPHSLCKQSLRRFDFEETESEKTSTKERDRHKVCWIHQEFFGNRSGKPVPQILMVNLKRLGFADATAYLQRMLLIRAYIYTLFQIYSSYTDHGGPPAIEHTLINQHRLI